MRAVLILAVLMAWATCLLGAVAIPIYLGTVAVMARRRRRPAGPPPLVAVLAFALFAAAMASCAAILAGLWGSGLAWAVVPAWTAICSAVAALMLGRRRRVPAPRRT